LIGYFLRNEGSNDFAWGLIAFDSLAAYKVYRARLKNDEEGMRNFALAQTQNSSCAKSERFYVVYPIRWCNPR